MVKKIIDGNGLLVFGRYNVWIYYYGIFKRLMWLFFIYEVLIIIIKVMKRKVSKFRVLLLIILIGFVYVVFF